MAFSAAMEPSSNKKHVRFASKEDDDDTLFNKTEDTSFDMTEDTSFNKTEDTSFDMTEDTSFNKTEDTSFDMTEDTSFNKTEDTSFNKTEDTSFNKTEDTGRRLKSAMKAVQRTVELDRGGRGERWLVSLALCGSFLGLGMSISVLGPTFPDLAVNLKTNISNISYIFAGRAAGYIGGSLVGGVIFECMNPYLMLGGSMLITACGMVAIPFCSHALLLAVFMAAIGMSMGTLDTGGNVLILNTWGDRAGPHMQALHFSFAAGAFMSPVIAKLLLGSSRTVNVTAGGPSVKGSVQLLHNQSFRSLWAYVIIGSFLLLMALLLLLLYARCRASRDKPPGEPGKTAVSKHHVALVVLLFFFFFFYVGAEVAYGSFIFTFAKDGAQMSESQAAGVNSLFWGAFAACRGLAIFFAACVYPGTLLLLSLAGSAFSSLLLCLFSRKEELLWLCSGLYGASMAATFPSGISWLEQYTAVTAGTASAFVVGAALGEMTLPALVGLLLGRFPEEPVLMYVSLTTATVTSVLFPVMYKLATSTGNHRLKPRPQVYLDSDDNQYRQALLEEEEQEEEPEEEQEREADQWNDADFEVIEMDNSLSLLNSPNRTDATG